MEKKVPLVIVCVALLLKPSYAETTKKDDDAFGLSIETYKPTGSSAERAYEDAQQIVKDAYASAQQSSASESAKENESQTIGDLGAQMRNPQDEL
ncbi:hypothetical protein Sjap_010349 [Stephania japonica]|uniref:Uncharacterized protein n=1 Tax=Stephania japonica TaxID=461633 RepID=A0AAP0P3J6_9MAGN